MPLTMHEILHPGSSETDARFANAPAGWTMAEAEQLARDEGLQLGDDHWEAIRVIQTVYAEDQSMPLRMVHDALDVRFGDKGGIRYLYSIMPGGPVTQGSRLAGLLPPLGATDRGFGTVS
jgi:TusE/DsrC/DsvC family sulfur relay protein